MVPSQRTGYAHPYMVTAAHVVNGANEVEARLRAIDGEILSWEASEWVYPEEPLMDLAVRPLDCPESGSNAVAAVPIGQALERSAPGKGPKLGNTVFFYGLLAVGGAERMGLEATPVLRTGNVAQLDQPNVTWDGMTADRVHLIDVRSRGGFSGSPCFAQFSFPGPRPPNTELPGAWEAEARASGGDPSTWGEFHTITAWWGMFVAHVESSGIGVVLPAQFILDFLESEPFVELQRLHDSEPGPPEAPSGLEP